MEWEINQAIVANVEIKTGYPSKEELAQMDYRSNIEIDGPVRIVEVLGYDVCACCAPHVHRTGEIGMFKIQSVQNYKGGMRISFLCGFRALEEYRRKSEIVSELSGILTTNQENLVDHVTKLREQVHNLKVQLSNEKQMRMEEKLAEQQAEAEAAETAEEIVEETIEEAPAGEELEPVCTCGVDCEGACPFPDGNEE
jgi:alanyl-tRNA synthetase